MIGIMVGDGNAATLLALSGLVVLEPVEDVLALDLAVKAEVGGDLLDLIGAWSSESRPE